MMRPKPFRQQQQTQNDRAKQTRPTLLKHKQKKFPKESIEPAASNMPLQPNADFMEACLCVTQHGGDDSNRRITPIVERLPQASDLLAPPVRWVSHPCAPPREGCDPASTVQHLVFPRECQPENNESQVIASKHISFHPASGLPRSAVPPSSLALLRGCLKS